jgi:hypothetical protein
VHVIYLKHPSAAGERHSLYGVARSLRRAEELREAAARDHGPEAVELCGRYAGDAAEENDR